jgi:hypothetical protein
MNKPSKQLEEFGIAWRELETQIGELILQFEAEHEVVVGEIELQHYRRVDPPDKQQLDVSVNFSSGIGERIQRNPRKPFLKPVPTAKD